MDPYRDNGKGYYTVMTIICPYVFNHYSEDKTLIEKNIGWAKYFNLIINNQYEYGYELHSHSIVDNQRVKNPLDFRTSKINFEYSGLLICCVFKKKF